MRTINAHSILLLLVAFGFCEAYHYHSASSVHISHSVRGRTAPTLASHRARHLTSHNLHIACTANSGPQAVNKQKNTWQKLRQIVRYPKRKVENTLNFFDTQLPMLKYIWPDDSPRLRLYLLSSMVFMFLSKWFNLKVPFLLQRAVDTLSLSGVGGSSTTGMAPVSRSVGLALCFYGLSRAVSVVCAEIKTCLFIHVSQNVLRRFGNTIFTTMHKLDSDFHVETPSGVLSVAYVRAIRGFQTMMFQLVFSVAPTILELAMVAHILSRKFAPSFAAITVATFVSYLCFTAAMTQWRVRIRNQLVDCDNQRNGFFIDSILNHEVVKLFNSEERERLRFDDFLQRIEDLSIETTYSIAVLNFGQAALFGLGLTSSLLIALNKVGMGMMTVGDLIAVNTMFLQLVVPFNLMGYTYQELRQSFVDMTYMRNILSGYQDQQAKQEQQGENVLGGGGGGGDKNIDKDFRFSNGPSMLEFRDVFFRYKKSRNAESRDTGIETESESESGLLTVASPAAAAAAVDEDMILKNVSFTINAGENVAIVGPSGSGKSTTLKLIMRMLDANEGKVLIDGKDVTNGSVAALRNQIGVVPQDTCLFDDTVLYNIKYGRPNATKEEVDMVVNESNLQETIAKLPDGLLTQVGERGARLSGGERQKVSIARALLCRPSLLLCDEITSSVDAFAEKEIVDALTRSSQVFPRTTITVAHRLSSIAHCDKIIVIKNGRVVEEGTHKSLLSIHNGVYRQMWQLQHLHQITAGLQGGEEGIEYELDTAANNSENGNSNDNNNYDNNNGGSGSGSGGGGG